MKKLQALLLFTFHFLLFTSLSAQTGHWTALRNTCPHYHNGGLALLTDGRVICHNTTGGGNGTGWDILTPDANGSYINGTWDTMASMTYDRLYFSMQVLPSGKVYVAGGEYGAGGVEGEVYDPVTNSWTTCGPIPNGWDIYDGNSEILYDGTVLEGPQIGSATSYNILIWDPNTLQYTAEPNSIYDHDEASWLKLPDSSVLFVGIGSEYSNRYIPQTATWVLDDTVPGYLFDPYGSESGGSAMMPNGQAIFFGATNYNAIYTPTGNPSPGKWTSAASFPNINGVAMGQVDAPSASMVNGHILLCVSPIGNSSSEFNSPAYFLEYDCSTGFFTQVKDTIPGFGGDSLPSTCYQVNMIDLPDGNVLVSNYQQGYSNKYLIYTPGSGPIPQGKPTINSIIAGGCPLYKITGKLFNGISEGASYGDDWQMETNYPIVRFTNGSNMYYAKTTNWNRIGAVRTDSLKDTATFSLPPNLPGGTYSVVVVANGFASNPVLFTTFGLATTESNVDCNGGTGMATAYLQGGISPYTYSWSPGGGTGNIATGLSAGIYTITTMDNNGCTITASVVITQPATPLAISTPVNTNESCFDASSASATASAATGGTSPYTYLWSPSGGNALTASGLSAGTYTITATDSHGCNATSSVTITQPAGMVITTDSVAQTTSNGCNGKASVTVVSGGASPYTYKWATNGQTTDTITGQCAGNYCCVITDHNGCSQTTCMEIKSTVGIANINSGNNNITIYPNPNKGIFTIQSLAVSGKSTVEIYNVLGQNIYSNTLNLSKGSDIEINLSDKSAGIYFYRLLKEDGNLLGEGKIVIDK
jgi:hypothetical protein